jgi:hypothetical protein
MNLRPDAALGGTEIFVSVDRYYPAGFRVEIGSGLAMALEPGESELRVVGSAGENDRRQAQLVRWDDDKLRLVIEKWTAADPELSIRIVPMPGVGG